MYDVTFSPIGPRGKSPSALETPTVANEAGAMTPAKTKHGAAHPGHRPRAFETVSPLMLDEVGWTREQILRIRANVQPVVFADRRQAVGEAAT